MFLLQRIRKNGEGNLRKIIGEQNIFFAEEKINILFFERERKGGKYLKKENLFWCRERRRPEKEKGMGNIWRRKKSLRI